MAPEEQAAERKTKKIQFITSVVTSFFLRYRKRQYLYLSNSKASMLWSAVSEAFQNRKAGLAIARLMIENGIRIDSSGRFYVGDVHISDVAIARAASVDRRAVRETARFILNNRQLNSILTKLKPSGSSLVNVAKELGFSVLKIESDPHASGVIAEVSEILAKHKVVIRQALADDPDLVPEPRLTLVVEGQLPSSALDEIRNLSCVKSLMIQN